MAPQASMPTSAGVGARGRRCMLLPAHIRPSGTGQAGLSVGRFYYAVMKGAPQPRRKHVASGRCSPRSGQGSPRGPGRCHRTKHHGGPVTDRRRRRPWRWMMPSLVGAPTDSGGVAPNTLPLHLSERFAPAVKPVALRHDMKPPPRSAQRACPFEELVLLEGFVRRMALLRGLAGVLVRGKGRLNLDGGSHARMKAVDRT